MSSIQEQVREIEDEISENNNTENFFLRYTEIGNSEYVDIIVNTHEIYIRIELWNSDDDIRKWIIKNGEDQYEDFKTFLKRKVMDVLHYIAEFKSILNHEKCKEEKN